MKLSAASLVTTTGAEAADGRDDPNREPRLWGLVDTARLRLASPQSAALTTYAVFRGECMIEWADDFRGPGGEPDYDVTKSVW